MCGYLVVMRLHIRLRDKLIAQLDRRVSQGRRDASIAEAVRRALKDERRWDDIEAGLGALAGPEHDWDDDPAGWVTTQRSYDSTRVG